MSQSSQSQPLLSPDDSIEAEDHTSSPPPQPGERRMQLCSQASSLHSNTASASSGGRLTRSNSRGRGTLPPHHQSGHIATPITPSRMTTGTARTEPKASWVYAPMSPNTYALLGEDDRTTAIAAPDNPPDPDPTDTTHGWDSFIHCLDDTTKGAM